MNFCVVVAVNLLLNQNTFLKNQPCQKLVNAVHGVNYLVRNELNSSAVNRGQPEASTLWLVNQVKPNLKTKTVICTEKVAQVPRPVKLYTLETFPIDKVAVSAVP